MAALDGTNKRISQKTFDETVRENVEEFEMEKEEALADAIEQFKTQGVDLTNIDTSGVDRSAQQKATSDAIESLKAAVTNDEDELDEDVCRQALVDLVASCTVSDADRVVGGPFYLCAPSAPSFFSLVPSPVCHFRH